MSSPHLFSSTETKIKELPERSEVCTPRVFRSEPSEGQNPSALQPMSQSRKQLPIGLLHKDILNEPELNMKETDDEARDEQGDKAHQQNDKDPEIRSTKVEACATGSDFSLQKTRSPLPQLQNFRPPTPVSLTNSSNSGSNQTESQDPPIQSKFVSRALITPPQAQISPRRRSPPSFRPHLKIQFDPEPPNPPRRRKKGMSGKVRRSLLLALQALSSGISTESQSNSSEELSSPIYRSDVVLLRRLEEARPVHRLRKPTRVAHQLVLLARDLKSDSRTVRSRLLVLAEEGETLDLSLEVPDFRVLGERGIRLALVHGNADWIGLRSLPENVLAHAIFELRFIVCASSAGATTENGPGHITSGPLEPPTGCTPDFTVSESTSLFTSSGSASTSGSLFMSRSSSSSLTDQYTFQRYGPNTPNNLSLSSISTDPPQTMMNGVDKSNENENTLKTLCLPSPVTECTAFTTTVTEPREDERNEDSFQDEELATCPSRPDSGSASDATTLADVPLGNEPQQFSAQSVSFTPPASSGPTPLIVSKTKMSLERRSVASSPRGSGTESGSSIGSDDDLPSSDGQVNMKMSMNVNENRNETTSSAVTSYMMDGIEIDMKMNARAITSPRKTRPKSPLKSASEILDDCLNELRSPRKAQVQVKSPCQTTSELQPSCAGCVRPCLKGQHGEVGQKKRNVGDNHEIANTSSPGHDKAKDSNTAQVILNANNSGPSNCCLYSSEIFQREADERRRLFEAGEADRRRKWEREGLEWVRLKQERKHFQDNVHAIISALGKAVDGLKEQAEQMGRWWDSIAAINACECKCRPSRKGR